MEVQGIIVTQAEEKNATKNKFRNTFQIGVKAIYGKRS